MISGQFIAWTSHKFTVWEQEREREEKKEKPAFKIEFNRLTQSDT